MLIWRFGRAYTATDDLDPTGRPVCIAPGENPPRFSDTERWQTLTWEIDGRFDGRLHITGRVEGRLVIDLYLHPPDYTDPMAMAVVEAIRSVLAGVPVRHESRRHQWVETPDSVPLDRCSRGHHVWPPGAYKDEDFCYCGQRHLREARRRV